MDESVKQKSLQVNIPEHLRAPVNANIIRVSTSPRTGEVIIDFVFIHPQDISKDGSQFGTLVSRVVLSLPVAKDLLAILNNHLGKIKSE